MILFWILHNLAFQIAFGVQNVYVSSQYGCSGASTDGNGQMATPFRNLVLAFESMTIADEYIIHVSPSATVYMHAGDDCTSQMGTGAHKTEVLHDISATGVTIKTWVCGSTIYCGSATDRARIEWWDPSIRVNLEDPIEVNFENLVLSGASLLKKDCTDEWCKHCHEPITLDCSPGPKLKSFPPTQSGLTDCTTHLQNIDGTNLYTIYDTASIGTDFSMTEKCDEDINYATAGNNVLFTLFAENSTMRFYNTDFEDFRARHVLFLLIMGNLELEEVNFYRIEAGNTKASLINTQATVTHESESHLFADGPAAIVGRPIIADSPLPVSPNGCQYIDAGDSISEADRSKSCYTFTWTTGELKHLNADVNYSASDESLVTRYVGFIDLYRPKDVTITSVDFTENIIPNHIDAEEDRRLVRITQPTKVVLDTVTFENNISFKGLLYIFVERDYLDTANYNDNSKYDVEIRTTVFNTNYGGAQQWTNGVNKPTLLEIGSDKPIKIRLFDCSFEQNQSDYQTNNMVKIYSNVIDVEDETGYDGYYNNLYANAGTSEFPIDAGNLFLILEEVDFIENYSSYEFAHQIEIQNIPYLTITDCIINKNTYWGSTSWNPLNTYYTWNYFITNNLITDLRGEAIDSSNWEGDRELANVLYTNYIYSVTMTGTTIQNNELTNGATMWLNNIWGVYTVDNCTFQSNSSTRGDGAALAVTSHIDSDVRDQQNWKISNSQFLSNDAQLGNGGAIRGIFVESAAAQDANRIYVLDCTFTSNNAIEGSAIFWAGAEVNIENSTFTSNVASSGAAVWFSNFLTPDISTNAAIVPKFQIQSGSFTNNRSTGWDGADIYVEEQAARAKIWVFIIDSVTFSGSNAVNKRGGSIKIKNNPPFGPAGDDAAKIINWNFSNMYFGRLSEGVIYFTASEGVTEINSCTFTGIRCEENGARASLSTAILKAESYGNTQRAGTGSTTLWVDFTDVTITSCDAEFLINTTNIDGQEDFRMYNVQISDSYGVSIYTSNAYVEIENCLFTNLQSSFGTILYAYNGTQVTITNSTGTNITGSKYGGSVYASDNGTQVVVTSFTITNSQAERGGVFFVEKSAFVEIYSSTFTSNRADQGAFIYVLLSQDATRATLVQSCTINNNSGEGAIFLFDAKFKLESSHLFDNNNVDLDGDTAATSGIYLTQSEISSSYNIFERHSGVGGCFFNSKVNSIITDNGSTFRYGECEYGSVAYMLDTTAEFFGSKFSNMHVQENGAFSTTRSIVKFDQSCKFSDFTAKTADVSSFAYFYQSTVEIKDSEIYNFNTTAIYAEENSYLLIQNTLIHDGGDEAGYGGALKCVKCTSVFIDNSKLYNLQAQQGAGVYLKGVEYADTPTMKYVTNSNFTNNTASHDGGGIYSMDDSITVTLSEFTSNSAVGNIDDNKGNAGAIGFLCDTLTTCTGTISNNIFNSNHAERNGGGIYWNWDEPVMSNNTYTDCTAVYGADIASFALKLSRQTDDSTSRRLTLETVPSGQIINDTIAFELLDHYGQPITTDESSEAVWWTNSTNNDTVTLAGTTTVSASEGVFYFDNLQITAAPGENTQVLLITNGLNTRRVSASASILSIDVQMRECVSGEIQTIQNACLVCDSGTYALDKQLCESCPDTAECFGGDKIFPESGYWRSNRYSDVMFECLRKESCLGHQDQASDLGACADGYTGNMWHSCKEDWSRTSKNTCSPCPDAATNGVRVGGIAVAVVLVVIFMVRSTMQAAKKPKEITSILLRIFLNYIQLVVLTASFNLDWPDLVHTFLSSSEAAGSASEQIFSFDCYLEGEGYDVDVYFQKLVMICLIPFIIVIISTIIWGIVAAVKRDVAVLQNQLVTTIIVLMFLVHPNIVKTTFAVFSCMEIDDGEFWLLDDLDIRCWQGDHTKFAISVALPGVIAWGIGIPTFALVLIYRNRKVLAEISTKAKYGFLYGGYYETRYYWEFMILYRKICIIFISVFLAAVSTNIQALAVIAVIAIAFYYQNIIQPYEFEPLNTLESRSIITSGVTIYCGLYFLTGKLNEGAKIAFFAAIVIANTYFLLYWLYHMAEALLVKVAKKKPALVMKFCKCWKAVIKEAHIVLASAPFDEPEPTGVRTASEHPALNSLKIEISITDDQTKKGDAEQEYLDTFNENAYINDPIAERQWSSFQHETTVITNPSKLQERETKLKKQRLNSTVESK